jgi:hypothetical protein
LSDEDGRFSRSVSVSQSSSSGSPSVAASSVTPARPSAKTDSGGSGKSADTQGTSGATSTKQKLDFYKSELDSWKSITKRDEDLLANERVSFRQQMYQDALQGDRQTTTFFQKKVDELQNELSKSKKDENSNSGGK